MLVLTRKRRERVVLGDSIHLTIVELGRNSVRIGIEAPPGVTILREELLLDAEDRNARTAWETDTQPAAPTQNV
jgi:carbon storage regulator CsrA